MSNARPETVVFLTILGVTIVYWILRGIGILTFLPGFVLWVLIFLSIGSGVIYFMPGRR